MTAFEDHWLPMCHSSHSNTGGNGGCKQQSYLNFCALENNLWALQPRKSVPVLLGAVDIVPCGTTLYPFAPYNNTSVYLGVIATSQLNVVWVK